MDDKTRNEIKQVLGLGMAAIALLAILCMVVVTPPDFSHQVLRSHSLTHWWLVFLAGCILFK